MEIFFGEYSDYKDQLEPMFEQHWDEIGLSGANDIPFKIDEQMYSTLESSGNYMGVGLKDKDKLIGYLSIFISKHPHHKDCIFATTDAFYVDKQYRGFKTFKMVERMFKAAEYKLKKDYGVRYLQMVCSSSNKLEGMAKHLGYQSSDVTYLKDLGE